VTGLRLACATLVAAGTLALGGCGTVASYDYSNFRQHPPRSILILPPINESTAVEGTYSYLSTVSRPVSERGYYVFPVAVVDAMLKENGMPTPGEMHQVPLDKVREITGADAVLFPVLHQYGSHYHLVSSDTVVNVTARLVDTRTGLTLWENTAIGQSGSQGSGNIVAALIAAAVTQAINSSTDPAHQVSRIANAQLFFTKNRELPPGPYDPRFGQIP
jgi:hypothetical protein